jgi:hypothetical protein
MGGKIILGYVFDVVEGIRDDDHDNNKNNK